MGTPGSAIFGPALPVGIDLHPLVLEPGSSGPPWSPPSTTPRKTRSRSGAVSATLMLPRPRLAAVVRHGGRGDRGRAAGHAALGIWKLTSPDWMLTATSPRSRSGSPTSRRSMNRLSGRTWKMAPFDEADLALEPRPGAHEVGLVEDHGLRWRSSHRASPRPSDLALDGDEPRTEGGCGAVDGGGAPRVSPVVPVTARRRPAIASTPRRM